MKRIYKKHIALFSIFFFLFASCEKELSTSPTTSVSEDKLFTTVQNIETVLNGTWSYMNDTYFTYANPGYGAILRTSDAMGSDAVINPSKYGFPAAYSFTQMQVTNDTRVSAFWTLLYKVIDNCNNIITRIDASTGSQEKKDQIKGQALALRANSYLTLATFYQFTYLKDPEAKAVPIYTEPAKPTSEGNPKASLKEVYNLIIADLKDADVLLSKYSRPVAMKYKINADVVKGLLARAYLNTGNWTEAAANAAAARKAYPLMNASEYTAGFNSLSNSEWIWGHGQTTDQSNASYNFHFLDVSSASSYYYSFMADPYFKDLFDANDIRSQLFLWDGLAGRQGSLRYQKFKFRENQTADIVLMRSAEMVLIEAEAKAREGLVNEAAERLNELKAIRKATLFDVAGKTPADVVAAVLIERRKELWGEGFALSDILRTQGKVVRKAFNTGGANAGPVYVTITNSEGKTLQVPGIGHSVLVLPDKTAFVANSPYYLFKIPELEINNNSRLND